jgi:hypothetical protein
LCLKNTWWSWGHKTKTLLCRLVDKVQRIFAFVPREFDINLSHPCGENFLLLKHYALGVPAKWHTCCSVIKTFSGAIAEKQGSNTTTAIPTAQPYFFWHLAVSQAWGGCTTVSSSCPLDLRSIFLCLVFVFLFSFSFSYFLSVLSFIFLYTKIHKN